MAQDNSTPYDTAETQLSPLYWILVFAVCGIGLMSLEYVLRDRGFASGPHASAAFWAYHRNLIEESDDDVIVLLGSSRVQTNVDVQQISQRLNQQVIQLAIAGSSPLPTIENIATNSSFRGLLILSISPQHAFSIRPVRIEKAQSYVNRFQEYRNSPGNRWEFELDLRSWLLASARQDFNWRTSLNRCLLYTSPSPRD